MGVSGYYDIRSERLEETDRFNPHRDHHYDHDPIQQIAKWSASLRLVERQLHAVPNQLDLVFRHHDDGVLARWIGVRRYGHVGATPEAVGALEDSSGSEDQLEGLS